MNDNIIILAPKQVDKVATATVKTENERKTVKTERKKMAEEAE